jgi:hypothetical protein
MVKKLNDLYSLAKPEGIALRVAAYQRRRMYARFLEETRVSPQETILDIGATNDRTYDASNYLEAWYPYKHKITALGMEDASFLENEYPGMRFVRGSGVALPFANQSFDVVHSSAVLEHVGSFERQATFVRECSRVARRAIFLTTPNRWFPVEFHTVLPLVHWLPRSWFRATMRLAKLHFFAEEANLNLLSRSDLKRLLSNISGYDFRVSSVSLGGWPSNLLSIGQRQ